MSEENNPVAPVNEQQNTKPITHSGELPDDMPPPTLDDENLPKPPKLKSSHKGLKIGLVVLLVLAIAGAAGWYFFMSSESSEPAPPVSTAAIDSPETLDDVPEGTNTETFTSDPYRITFQYPKNWKVVEANDNSLLIESSTFNYRTAAGEKKNGNFRVYVRKGATTADSEIIAKGVAIQASTKLVYTKPSPAQRTETNLSLFGLDTEDNFAFLLITSNFTLQKGDTLGPNFGKEVDTIVIGGGFSEPGKEPGMATNPVPVDGFQNTNAYKQAIGIIESFEIM